MTSGFETFLKESLHAFMVGEATYVARHAAVPLAVHIEDSFLSLHSFDALVRALNLQCRYFRALGITEIRVVATALEIPRKDRFRAWVEYSYLQGDTVMPETSKVIYYGHRTSNQVVVEMVQYQTFAHPRLKRLIPPTSWAT